MFTQCIGRRARSVLWGSGLLSSSGTLVISHGQCGYKWKVNDWSRLRGGGVGQNCSAVRKIARRIHHMRIFDSSEDVRTGYRPRSSLRLLEPIVVVNASEDVEVRTPT